MGSRPLKADAELLKTTIFIGFGTQGQVRILSLRPIGTPVTQRVTGVFQFGPAIPTGWNSTRTGGQI